MPYRYRDRDTSLYEKDFYPSVPARDLTDAEYAALDPDQQANVDSGRLYAVDSAFDFLTEAGGRMLAEWEDVLVQEPA